MSALTVRNFFKQKNLEKLVIYNEIVSDTVLNAARMLKCEPKQIAKTMAFLIDDNPVIIVMSGEAKIDNSKYRAFFKKKAKMIPLNNLETIIGHSSGGICPFALNNNVEVYLDISLKRFDIVYTGGGDEHNIVKVTIKQLENYSNYLKWIDVCNNWEVK